MGPNFDSRRIPVKNALVIFPLHQLYLPEFDAYGMLPSFQSYVITDSGDVRGKIIDKVKVIDARFRVVPLGKLLTYSFSFVDQLEAIISNIQPIVIFTYESYSTFSYQVSKLAKRLGFKHVVVSYETIPLKKALWGFFPFTRYFHRVVKREADHFIALSKKIRDSLIASGIDEDKISTIYPGIKIPALDRTSMNAPQSRKYRVLFMGRLRSNKGIVTMLKAFKLFSESAPSNVELVVAGDGPLEPLVISEVSASSNIRFEGFVYGSRKEALLREADLFVYPSEDQVYPFGLKRWEEQTAAAVREAMAFGLPVIVSDSGSLPELVGREDVVFRQGNAVELSEKIKMLYSSSDLSMELSDFNVDRCRTLFSMVEFARHIEQPVVGNGESTPVMPGTED